MPDWYGSSIPTLLQDARRLFANAKDDAEIAEKLALYKVPEAQLDEGLAMIAAVVESGEDVSGEEVDRVQATGRVRESVEAVRSALADDRDLSRTVYDRASEAYTALRLRGRTPDARAEVLDEARAFYGALQARPALIDPIPGLSVEVVGERLAAVEAAAEDDRQQTAEKGEVDVASDDRKAAIAALRDHGSKTARIAKTALKDRPQLLEKLGLLARS